MVYNISRKRFRFYPNDNQRYQKEKKKKKKPKINDIKGHNTIDNKNKDLNVDSNKDKIINKVNIENIEEKNEDNKEMSPNEQKKFQNCDTTLIKENKSNNYIGKKNKFVFLFQFLKEVLYYIIIEN